MKKVTLLFAAVILSVSGFSQAPAIQWQKCIGGDTLDMASSIKQTSDGGYVLIGRTYSNDGDAIGNHGGFDCLVTKLDSSGSFQWKKCYGGTKDDFGNDIIQTLDGGYIITGTTKSNDGDVFGNHDTTGTYSDCWILKLDALGNMQWQKCFGGTRDDSGRSILQTSGADYMVGGMTFSNNGDVNGNHSFVNGVPDYWILTLNASGILQWQKCFGGSGYDQGISIIQASDGSFVAAGTSNSNDGDVNGNHGDWDCWIVKIDSVGTILWQKCFGGSDSDFAVSINQTIDGGYIMGGYTRSNDGDVTGFHGFWDCWIVKLSASGVIQWQKCYGGTNEDLNAVVLQTSDGGFIFAATTASNDGDVVGLHGYGDFWIVKLNSSGNIQWQKCLGGTSEEFAFSIQQTTDGGFIVAGRTTSNNGDVTGNHGDFDYWVAKLSAYVGIEEQTNSVSVNIFPNPATNELTIENGESKIEIVELYDEIGEKIFSQISNLKPHILIDISQLLPGIYFITLTDEARNKLIKKVVKM